MTQRRNTSSTDGFISNNGGRQVGFNGGSMPRMHQNLTPQTATRIRRPGLHTAGPRNQRLTSSNPLQSQRSVAQSAVGAMPDSQALPGVRRPVYGQSQPESGRGRKQDKKFGRRNRNNALGRAKDRRFSWKKLFKYTGIFLGIIVLIIAGWFSWKLYQNSKRVFGDSNILGFLNASKLKGEDVGHVNILLAGVSTDDAGHEGADLTDSIMLISIDTNNKKAFMLSVPRDLWVDIPEYGHSKINAANAYGDSDDFKQSGYPDGGMGLLEQTLEQSLEVDINYYAKVNYSALRDAVNAVGGVTVNIQSEDPRGFYDPNISWVDKGPLKVPNGVQTLDGQTALNLARARGDPCGCGRYGYGYAKSDFTRTQNQRMLLLALKDKVASGSTFANPVKLSSLMDTVGKNTKTDLQPSEVRRLYDLGKQIDSKNIMSLSLNDANGKNLLASYTTSDGASALIPAAGVDDFSDIQLFIKKSMTNDPVVSESAKVVVLNGGDISGLASKYNNVLTSKGMDVVAVGDAEPLTGASKIIDLSAGKKQNTLTALKKQFGNQVTTTNDTGYTEADFIIVLGTGQKAPASTSSDDN